MALSPQPSHQLEERADQGMGEDCTEHCFSDQVAEINLFSANPVTDSEYPDLTSVPTCYHHLKVFSKSKALSLPPHRPMTAPST